MPYVPYGPYYPVYPYNPIYLYSTDTDLGAGNSFTVTAGTVESANSTVITDGL